MKKNILGLLAVALLAGQAHADVITYTDNMAGFLAATGATSIGSLPDLAGGLNTRTIGSVTFDAVDVGTNSVMFFGPRTIEIAGNELGFSGPENFDMTIAGGAYAFGFQMVDVFYDEAASQAGCRNASTQTCVDSPYTIELFSGAASLGIFDYNAPNDFTPTNDGIAGFFGVHSSMAFDRIAVRDVNNNVDNEFFGNFVRGSGALVPPTTPIPEPTTVALLGLGIAGLVLTRRRKAFLPIAARDAT